MAKMDMLDAAYKAHVACWGKWHRLRLTDQTVEEMAELIKELMKERLGKRVKVKEELADVMLCLLFLAEDDKLLEDGGWLENRIDQLSQKLLRKLKRIMVEVPPERRAHVSENTT